MWWTRGSSVGRSAVRSPPGHRSRNEQQRGSEAGGIPTSHTLSPRKARALAFHCRRGILPCRLGGGGMRGTLPPSLLLLPPSPSKASAPLVLARNWAGAAQSASLCSLSDADADADAAVGQRFRNRGGGGGWATTERKLLIGAQPLRHWVGACAHVVKGTRRGAQCRLQQQTGSHAAAMCGGGRGCSKRACLSVNTCTAAATECDGAMSRRNPVSRLPLLALQPAIPQAPDTLHTLYRQLPARATPLATAHCIAVGVSPTAAALPPKPPSTSACLQCASHHAAAVPASAPVPHAARHGHPLAARLSLFLLPSLIDMCRLLS